MNKEKAEKAIKVGWIAALISATLTAISSIVPIVRGVSVLDFNPLIFLDVGILLGLGFGVYQKNRTAATVLFIYFIIGKIDIIYFRESYSSIPIGLIFLYFYFQAMRGTYVYKSLSSNNENTNK